LQRFQLKRKLLPAHVLRHSPKGIGIRFVPIEQANAMALKRPESADLQSVLSSHCHSCNAGPQMQNLGSIDDAFSGGDVLDVVSRLESMEAGSAGEWAGKTRASILSKSPTSLEVAFRQISRGAGLTLSECMKMEFRILMRLLPGKEFYEGIRAVIIDKDGAPVWSPASLAQVDTEEIEKHFASLGDKELKL